MTSSPHEQSTIRPPHPLAIEIAARLAEHHGARVVDYCSGSGRNAAFLRRTGFDVLEVPDDRARAFESAIGTHEFAGLVSSHGLLHGSAREMPQRVDALSRHVERGGLFAATFGSKRDARYRRGTRLDIDTYAALAGDEIGVAHAYFNERSLRTMLEPIFQVEVLEERDATKTAGAWAHPTPLAQAVHWVFIGRR